MKAPNKIYVEVCEDGIFAFPEPPFKESVEYVRAELVGQSLQREQPELPDNLDEAAEEYMKKARKHLFDDSPIGRADDAFKAGAEWMAARRMK